MRNPIPFALAVVVLCSGVVQAQSLAEVAKKEEQRRKTVKGSGKVYTNDDLRAYPVTTPAVLPGQGEAAAAGQKPGDASRPSAGAEAGIPAPEKVGEEKKDETYWKKLITDAREQLRRSEGFLEAMQTRVNALTNDFYARDDPAQRALVWSQRTAALEEIDRLKKEIAGYKETIASIEEDARREGVPPGWLR